MDRIPPGLSATYWSTWHQSARSVSESLDEGEAWIGGWDGVGLYEGNNKVEQYQSLFIHITTHRLLVVPQPAPSLVPALQTPLSFVRQTEFYNGFMRSSPKITLFLGAATSATASMSQEPERAAVADGAGWTCGVCGYVNAGAAACKLCGVSRSISASLPPTRSTTPAPLPRSTSVAPAASPSSSHLSTGQAGQIACPACTFLNHPSLRTCEMCATPLPRAERAAEVRPRPASMSAASGPKQDVVRLSFRKGGEREAYRRLKNVLGQRAWEIKLVRREQAGAGIDGIMKTIDLGAQAQDEHMKTAFDDLEVLMVRAGEMVRLAQSLSSRLHASATSEDASLIHTSLVQLGLPAPAITPDMVRSEREYEAGLARELGALLTGDGRGDGLMVGKAGRGVIGIDEVWGLWMRARGVALLPPSTLLSVIPHLPSYTSPPIHLLTLPSGLKVLHMPHFAPAAVLARILYLLQPTASPDDTPTSPATEKSLNVVDVAAHEGVAIALAIEILESIERGAQATLSAGVAKSAFGVTLSRRKQGSPVLNNRGSGVNGLTGAVEDDAAAMGLVRDDQAVGGTRWYRDLITAWPVDATAA